MSSAHSKVRAGIKKRMLYFISAADKQVCIPQKSVNLAGIDYEFSCMKKSIEQASFIQLPTLLFYVLCMLTFSYFGFNTVSE
jgi:hypothetical protein